MLVLTRKTNEAIYIGDDIKITIVKIKGGSVRIGVEAPSDVKIARHELKGLKTNGKDEIRTKDAPQNQRVA